jgi:hypothetical protein
MVTGAGWQLGNCVQLDSGRVTMTGARSDGRKAQFAKKARTTNTCRQQSNRHGALPVITGTKHHKITMKITM